MWKLLTTIYFVLALSTVSLSQVILNCSSFRTCKAYRLSPTTKGSNVDYSYYQCVGGCCGGGFSACLNNTPGDGSICGKYGCESKCNGASPNFTGFTHTYYDCEDTLHIDTTTCQATCSTPTPTPTPSQVRPRTPFVTLRRETPARVISGTMTRASATATR